MGGLEALATGQKIVCLGEAGPQPDEIRVDVQL